MSYLSHEEVQCELLELLSVFDEFASKNNLRYSLDGGTLLGAIRHQGFIPWDDDIDLIMPRPDFKRLISLAGTEPQGYRMMSMFTGGAPIPYIKFSNLAIRCQEMSVYDVFDEYLWVDVFPADGLCGDEGRNRALIRKVNRRNRYASRALFPGEGIGGLAKTVYKRSFGRLFTWERLYMQANLLAQTYPFDTSEWCRNIVANGYSYGAGRYFVDDFDHLKRREFCGRMFPAINHWHDYLTGTFGDYMQLPPVEERKSHEALAWRV